MYSNNNNKYILLFLVVVVFISYTNGEAPVLTKIVPSFSKRLNSVTVIGSGFDSLTPTVWSSGQSKVSSNKNETAKSFELFGPDLDILEISVQSSTGEMSNTVSIHVIIVNINSFIQINQDYYIVGGKFNNIPHIELLRIKSSRGETFYPITYLNSTMMMFKMNMELAKSDFGLYDGYSGQIEAYYQTPFWPVVSSVVVGSSSLIVSGYVYTDVTVVSIGDQNLGCEIQSFDETTIRCASLFQGISFFSRDLKVIVTHTNVSRTTVYYHPFVPLVGCINDNEYSSLLVEDFNPLAGINYIVNGLHSNPIPVTSSNSSHVQIQYPLDSQCGAAFISNADIRVTNNDIVCPTPVILNSIFIPNANGGTVIVNGYFFYKLLYGTIDTIAITYTVDIGDGNIPKPCNSVSQAWNSNNSTYTVTCDFNSPGTFKFIATTMIDQTSSVVLGYNPTITSSTSTKYGVPGIITIIGSKFVNLDLHVSIGGSVCQNAKASPNGESITCSFQSDVAMIDNNAIDVFVGMGTTLNSTKAVFLYTKANECPTGSNKQVCSGHGTCNSQLTCDCDKGWESFDCSINSGTIIPDPSVNPNDTSSTIITPSGTLFDIGIVLINEIDNNNNIVQSYNVSSINWNNITKQDNQHSYTTTFPNTNATLNVKLTVNTLDERIYYNFAGDVIPILPKSIKYQVELQNYTFSASLNTMEFIFKSGIMKEGGECIYDESTNTQLIGNSVRSIQMTLNGETLIGTFSDRIVLDDRPSYNKVNKLTNDQITKYKLNQESIYVSITTSTFRQSVVVDPNFGVLISSKPDPDACKKPFAAWKVGLIVAAGVIAIALIVGTVMLIKKKKVQADFNAKLKKLNNIDNKP